MIDAALQHNQGLHRTNRQVDELLSTGSSILSNLRDQRGTLKGVQRRILDMMTTLGLSNTVMRLIDRRTHQDKYILLGGMIVTCIIMLLVWKYLVWCQKFLCGHAILLVHWKVISIQYFMTYAKGFIIFYAADQFCTSVNLHNYTVVTCSYFIRVHLIMTGYIMALHVPVWQECCSCLCSLFRLRLVIRSSIAVIVQYQLQLQISRWVCMIKKPSKNMFCNKSNCKVINVEVS